MAANYLDFQLGQFFEQQHDITWALKHKLVT